MKRKTYRAYAVKIGIVNDPENQFNHGKHFLDIVSLNGNKQTVCIGDLAEVCGFMEDQIQFITQD